MADQQQPKKDGKATVTADDILQKLRHVETTSPVAPEAALEIKEWKMRTPAYKALTEDGKDEVSNKDKGKKGAARKK